MIHRGASVTTSTRGLRSPFAAPLLGGPLEPAHPHLTQMLMRADVQSELALTARQRETLDANKTRADMEIRQQARQDAKRIQDLQTDAVSLTSGERIARAHDVIEAIKQDHLVYESESDRRTVAALTAGQIKRLTELDLQWRGPLALAAPNLADTLQLSDTQIAAIQTQADDYARAQDAALGAAAAALRPPAPLRAEEKTARVQNERGTAVVEMHSSLVTMTAQQLHERDMKTVAVLQSAQQARQAAEAGILALLTPEQAQQWKALLGSPFAFHPN